MKPIEQAFLSSILESPDDDAPRLIYADWLEEHHDKDHPDYLVRAEFIRVQCEIARARCSSQPPCKLFNEGLPEQMQGWCGKCCRMDALRRREGDLLPTNAWDWAGKVFRAACIAGTHYQDALVFRRGFIEEITLPLADWLQHGPALVKAAPLRVVRLSDYKPRREGNGWFYPNNLLELLPETGHFFPAVGRRHATEADALAVVSRVCLDYAHLVQYGRHLQNTKTVPS